MYYFSFHSCSRFYFNLGYLLLGLFCTLQCKEDQKNQQYGSLLILNPDLLGIEHEGSFLYLAFFELFTNKSYTFLKASNDNIFSSSTKYLIFGFNKLFKRELWDVANIKKKWLTFECSFSKKLYAVQARGTVCSHSKLPEIYFAIHANCGW